MERTQWFGLASAPPERSNAYLGVKIEHLRGRSTSPQFSRWRRPGLWSTHQTPIPYHEDRVDCGFPDALSAVYVHGITRIRGRIRGGQIDSKITRCRVPCNASLKVARCRTTCLFHPYADRYHALLIDITRQQAVTTPAQRPVSDTSKHGLHATDQPPRRMVHQEERTGRRPGEDESHTPEMEHGYHERSLDDRRARYAERRLPD